MCLGSRLGLLALLWRVSECRSEPKVHVSVYKTWELSALCILNVTQTCALYFLERVH
jgi:hypothetical protein